MRVRAKVIVFYGGKRRRPGDIFTLVERKGSLVDKNGKKSPITLSVEQQFSQTSMEKVGGKGPADQASSAKQAVAREKAAAAEEVKSSGDTDVL